MSRILFMGTPNFAAHSLETLLQQGFDIALVVCQPDRKQGRGHKMQAPPVKRLALEHGIEVFQPEKPNDDESYEHLRKVQADFFAVVAYGRILSQRLLDLPKLDCINLHASLLPKYRGASPIQACLLAGDEVSGVSSMRMSKKMDTGDVLISRSLKLDPAECVGTLETKLADLGAEVLAETLKTYASITPQAQDETQATYCGLLGKEDQKLDFNRPASECFNRWRAFAPKPGAFCLRGQKRLKLLDVKLEPDLQGEPGQVLAMDEAGFSLACAQGGLKVLQCQPESKPPMSGAAYAHGYQLSLGDKLGE